MGNGGNNVMRKLSTNCNNQFLLDHIDYIEDNKDRNFFNFSHLYRYKVGFKK